MNAELFTIEVENFWNKVDFNLKKDCDGVLIDWENLPGEKNSVILGQYIIKRPFKPRIVLYYKSFIKIFGKNSEIIKQKIDEVIRHELTHHVEFLNGTNTMAKKEKAQKSIVDLKSILFLLVMCILLITVLYYFFT